jgi:hypothetical protein
MDNEQKAEAHTFLAKLESMLKSSLPQPEEVQKSLADITAASKTDDLKKHTRIRESAFINTYVIGKLSEFIQANNSMSSIDARQALLVEGFQNTALKPFCSGTPARTLGHPFTKLLGATTEEIAENWTAKDSIAKPCPDFALRPPFPFKIVFEGKCFDGGSPKTARRDLVSNIYQAFFYRALPYVEARNGGPAWDYDYACLLAYDASKDGTLRAAWNQLAPKVRDGFWTGANVYVMILGGKSACSQAE